MSVIIEADAIEIAHPLPSNPASSMILSAPSLTKIVSLSPHRGLLPFAS